MKLVTWNCKGPHRNTKFEIDNFRENIKWLKETYPDADLFAIQECSKEQVDSIRGNAEYGAKYAAWYGDDIDWFMRGTALFSNKRCFTEREEFYHNPDFRYVVPYSINIKEESLIFTLFNVWTKAKPQNYKAYKTTNYHFYEKNVTEALAYYSELNFYPNTGIFDKPCLMIGDFNFGRNVAEVKNTFGKEINKYGFVIPDMSENLVTFKNNKSSFYFNDTCIVNGLKAVILQQAVTFDSMKDRSDHIPVAFEISSK
jgi:exonuclease III